MPPKKKAQPEPEQVDTGPEEEVEVEMGENPGETATLLLAAAEEAGLDQAVVRTGTGVFYVPKSIANKAKK